MSAYLSAGALLAGCGGAGPPGALTPHRVPRGAVAIVGAVPITTSSFDHWLGVLADEQRPVRATARTRRRAVQRTVSFLVKAQWLVQESRAEGINEAVLNKLVSQQANQQSPSSGMTRSDITFQARLNTIAEALQGRHGTVSVSTAEVAHYYASHRSLFSSPAVRDTLMVVTRDRTRALKVRAALASGQRWAAVAKRWSIDPSALAGGADAVSEGAQSPTLVRAVFAARRDRITGPVRATPTAQPTVNDYYVFKVTGEQPASYRPLTQVTAEIHQTLSEREHQRVLAAFTSAYEQRWHTRTLCAPGYVIPECRNYTVATRGHEP